MAATKRSISALTKWMHKSSGYCKYGLYRDDCLYEYPHVQEALKRLPQNIHDERNYRITIATYYSMKKRVLPEENWISLEEDLEKGRYLQPYINEVLKEWKEMGEWCSK